MIFETLSGSVYELDLKNQRARRLYRAASSEADRPGDANWKPCLDADVEVGRGALIHWHTLPDGTFQLTHTTPVVEIRRPD